MKSICVDRRKSYQVILLFEEVLVSVPEDGRRRGFELPLESPQGT